MNHENYQDVVHQLEQFGCLFRDRDLPLKIDHPKKVTCGKGGKWWYWLRTFRPNSGGAYVVGRFGCYRDGANEKVDVDWSRLGDEERERMRLEREAAERAARAAREEAARLAALTANELWREGRVQGTSEYLKRKGVEPECCRFLPDGSIVLPLLRYDLPRDQALKGTQRIYRNGKKIFTRDFAKVGCALRLGQAVDGDTLLVCEGYATALSIRMATQQSHAVFIALDAYNLPPVVEILRRQYPASRLLICADDDWQTHDHTGAPWNAGRVKAMEAAKHIDRCDIVWPVFARVKREPKDTDFNDLHLRAGLGVVARQLRSAIEAIKRFRSV